MVPLEKPSFLWKALWKVGTRMPREYCARSNHSLEDKLWGKKPTINEEISEKNAATTTLNAMYPTNWPHLCGNDT